MNGRYDRLLPLETAQRDLVQALGTPEEDKKVIRSEGTWHVHNGGWSPGSKSIVYTQDQDYGDLYELIEKR